MSYTVLARKYRSKTFDDVVGQGPIATTLKNAIQSGRIHHGYLFTGTRGVGKTSMARILAKALNCLRFDAPTITPCNECDSCLAIAAGEDVDVIEIDAASNTGVDNIRELRSNAIYRPARARYKIYIIDEVHMLSTGAFNALLKTLEEPPEHVKFILATTEPQKVPATIQSRVQRFDFRPISPAGIADQLARICRAERIEAQPSALRRIARLANGSMRDAVSLLDQLLSIGAHELSLDLLEQVLPRPGDEQVCELVDRMIAQDAAGALGVLDEIISSGHAMESLVVSLMEHLRGMMLLRICGPQTDLVDAAEALRARMAEQAKAFDEPVYVYVLSLLEDLRRGIRYSGAGRSLIEAVIVRLCMLDAFTSLGAVAAAGAGRPSVPAQPATARSGPPRPPPESPGHPAPTKKGDSPSSGEAAVTGPEPAPPLSAADMAAAARQKLAEARGRAMPSVVGASIRPAAVPGRQPPARDTSAPAGARSAAGQTSEATPSAASSSDDPTTRGLATSAVARGTSSQDIRKVTGNSVVRRAIELFEGTLVGVRPLTPSEAEGSVQDKRAAGPGPVPVVEADTMDMDDP